jgi:hypothetical protein
MLHRLEPAVAGARAAAAGTVGRVLGDLMKIAYSRDAMHSLMALQAPQRKRAIATAQALAASDSDDESRISGLLPVAQGSEFRLAPFSTTGDLVVTQENGTLIIVALSNVIGSLKEATEL